ncbi:hypothetical protein [Mycobacterium hubeiense]|uniref:hypothetical protein n=1 Tax=Mycobacterium hubeiense TaxID=1867256 RepID=UPI000C7F02F5|nr:hypothetical protein [Mycobacterium sp. QGD 101]
MGGGFARRTARQHPDLISTTPRATVDPGAEDPSIRVVVLSLLAVDGIISAVAGALLLPFSIGAIPFPVSALVTGAVNAALVWAAMYWTDSMRLAALPLWTWLATVAAMTLGGPGGDIIFGGRGVMGYSVLIFIALGTLPAAWLLFRRR